ncbi:molybdopterin-guanine dinucleotide biosynthesis protein B [Bhargavaea ullalensis]|uniref:Molybdopterin-guanine dinucleotide biosynthesis protein B n=1 Tax=Bhargavaea ullalensis TaxID=1265685 RepID=A0ABV2G7A9_9BACL
MDGVRVLQVAGFKNSGKTAIIRELLGEARVLGLKTAAVKHHGHGGPPALPDPGTDSMKFFADGAAVSAVAGGGIAQVHLDMDDGDPEPLIRLAAAVRPDLVFIEGFKKANYEKIAVARTTEDWQELKGLPNIVLSVVPEEADADGDRAVWGDNEAIRGWFGRWWEGGTGYVRL